MNRQELLERSVGLSEWLRENLTHEFYNGVKAYYKNLLNLLYQSKTT